MAGFPSMYMLTVSYSCIQIPNDIFNLEPTKYYGLKLSGLDFHG